MTHAVSSRRICTSIVAGAIALLLLLAVTDAARADDDDRGGKKDKRERDRDHDDGEDEDGEDRPRPAGDTSPLASVAPTDHPRSCVPGLEVRPDQDVNRLGWPATAATDGYAVHRGTNGRPYETLVVLPAENTTYDDVEVVPGAVYRYQVTGATGGPHATCKTVEVTAVPEFPGAAASLAALGVGLCAYGLARRRSR